MSTPQRQPWATSRRPWGVLAPVLTPFDASGAVDLPAFIDHCRWLVSQGVGLVLFTAGSETAHLSLAERQRLLDAVLAAGIAADRVIAQVRFERPEHSIASARDALDAGVAGLMLSGSCDDARGLLDRLADRRVALYLCGSAFDSAALERLMTRHVASVAGLWQQGTDPRTLAELLSTCLPLGLQVFTSDEIQLAHDLSRGAAGCITPLANVCPAWLARVCADEADRHRDAAQASVVRAARAFRAHPFLSASMKHVLAQWTEHMSWQRSPLSTDALAESDLTRLMTELLLMRFDMPRLRVPA